MARMRPELTDSHLKQLTSRGEARLYVACRDQLKSEVLVKHSASLLRVSRFGQPEEIEADFVVFDPEKGFLVIEVKGGQIQYDAVSGRWTSVDATGHKHEIKDPFKQATSQKHAIIEVIRSDRHWRAAGRSRVLAGHSVFFPDCDLISGVTLSGPKEIVGTQSDLGNFSGWVDSVFRYWAGGQVGYGPLGSVGLQVAERAFCSPVLVRPLVSTRLREEEIVRVLLTEQQSQLLQAINLRKVAAICGGAGTGKTLLAVERAKRLAAQGLKTLLLCYNRGLADHLKVAVEGFSTNLHTMSFHQLCQWRAQCIAESTGRNLLREANGMHPGADLYSVQLPYALARSTELSSFRYDALVVDEGQDFREEFWFPVTRLLKDDEPHFYIFFDPNQRIYQRVASFPISEPPFLLTANCRNTRFIHEAAYRYFSGEETSPPRIEGVPIQAFVATSLQAQCAKIHSEISNLIARERVAASDIVVLVAGHNKNAYYSLLSSKRLPSNIKWAVEQHRLPNTVILDTVSRFKGLESSIVFLCGLDTLNSAGEGEIIYIGLSRAKSRVCVVGSRETCDLVVQGQPFAVTK